MWSAVAGAQGQSVRASVLLSRVLVEAGVTPAVHLHGPAELAMPHHHPQVPGWHVDGVPGATEVAVRAVLDRLLHCGSPCSDDPASISEVTGDLVASHAVT